LNIRTASSHDEYIYDFDFIKANNSKNIYSIKNGTLVNTLPKEEEFVLFAKKEKKKSGRSTLFKISIDNLKRNNFSQAKIVDKTNRKIEGYIYDNQFERIITTEFVNNNEELLFKWRSLKSNKWQKLFSYSNEKYQILPHGFITQDKLAVLSNKDTDKIALHEFDIKTQTLGKVLFQHPKYDLQNVKIGPNGSIESVHYYQNGVYTTHYFKLDDKKFSSKLAKTFNNNVSVIIDSDKSDSKHLIYTTASDYSGAYFLFEKSKNKMTKLYEAYPDLEKYTFAKTIHIPINSTDSQQLEAFLTKPISVDHNTLLVMPHGGPIGVQETDYFNPNVQYLVNRGFTVLRVNFRGSSGYGKAFLEQGVGQFGQLIEQDITATVNQVLEHNQFKHICSIGSSYGGYSAVMLAIKHPQQYHCVVAAYGIYDLPLLFNASNYRSGKEYHDYIAKVVGKLDESHLKLSPTYMSEKLKAPLLLIAGKDDDISGIEQSNRFNFVLKRNNKPVETIFYDQTGHGHSSWWGERHELISTVDFLYQTLAINEPKEAEISVDEKIALAKDHTLLADSYDFEHKVSKNSKKAYRHYLEAAKYQDSRSLFNVGSYYHRGELVEKDINTAVDYYIKSAELDYKGANRRLGRMYMEGQTIQKDFVKAFKYLSKAYVLDDSLFNSMRLGRFYCVASEKYKDMEKCINNFKLKGIDNLSLTKQKEVYNIRKKEIARTLIDGNYSKEEFFQLQSFIKNTYKLTHVRFDFEVERSGTFIFQHNEKFGKPGKYILIDESNKVQRIQEKNLIYGLYFKTDINGIDTRKDKIVIIAKWTKVSKTGESKTVNTLFLSGNPVDEWSALRQVSINDEPATYRLDIYDLNKKNIYTKDFIVN
jgi:dipeptidyl aminopeptidase/acylaminoacyl peptidase